MTFAIDGSDLVSILAPPKSPKNNQKTANNKTPNPSRPTRKVEVFSPKVHHLHSSGLGATSQGGRDGW